MLAKVCTLSSPMAPDILSLPPPSVRLFVLAMMLLSTAPEFAKSRNNSLGDERLPPLTVTPPVMVFAALRVRMPTPVLVKPVDPAITLEMTVAAPLVVVIVGEPVRVRVPEPEIVYPGVLKTRPDAETAEFRVTAPAVPAKTAALPSAQLPRVPVSLPERQVLAVVQVPRPPVPPVAPLASQKRLVCADAEEIATRALEARMNWRRRIVSLMTVGCVSG